jgi:hypothetical protein
MDGAEDAVRVPIVDSSVHCAPLACIRPSACPAPGNHNPDSRPDSRPDSEQFVKFTTPAMCQVRSARRAPSKQPYVDAWDTDTQYL